LFLPLADLRRWLRFLGKRNRPRRNRSTKATSTPRAGSSLTGVIRVFVVTLLAGERHDQIVVLWDQQPAMGSATSDPDFATYTNRRND
jgi:hypothetical protein